MSESVTAAAPTRLRLGSLTKDPSRETTSNSRLRLLSVLAWALSFGPSIYAVATYANIPSAYSENVGYRFFQALRWVDGAPGDFIHPGQGVLLPLIQSLYYIFGKVLLHNVADQLLLFSHLTIALPVIVSLILVWRISADSVLPHNVRTILIVALPAISVTHSHLFAWHIYPDYVAYVKPLFLFSFYFYIRNFVFKSSNAEDWIKLGALAGLMAALKINLGIFILALALLQNGFFTTGVSATIVFALLMYGFYGHELKHYSAYFDDLLSTVSEWGVEKNFTAYSPFGLWSDHSYTNLPWLIAILVVVAVFQCRSQCARKAVLLSILLAGLALYMVFRRGGGSSYTDAVVIVTFLIVLMCSFSPVRSLTNFLACVAAGGSLIWVSHNLEDYLSYHGNLPGMGAGYWQKPLYDWNRSHKLDIVCIFPDNGHVTGTIEDMLLRGFSNFAKPWGQSMGNLSKKEIFPQYMFGSAEMELAGPSVVMWLTSSEPFSLVGESALRTHKVAMAAFLAKMNVGPCYSVRHPIYGPEIRSCVVSPH